MISKPSQLEILTGEAQVSYPARLMRHKTSLDLQWEIKIPGETIYYPLFGTSWSMISNYDLELDGETEVYQYLKIKARKAASAGKGNSHLNSLKS